MKKIILLLAILTLSTPNTFADGDDKKALVCSKVDKEEFTKIMNHHQDKFLKKLKLSKEQDKQVDQIQKNYADKFFSQVQKIRGAHIEVMGAIEKNSSNEIVRDRIMTLEKEKQSLLWMKLDQTFEIRNLLNGEQRLKVTLEFKEKMDDLCD